MSRRSLRKCIFFSSLLLLYSIRPALSVTFHRGISESWQHHAIYGEIRPAGLNLLFLVQMTAAVQDRVIDLVGGVADILPWVVRMRLDMVYVYFSYFFRHNFSFKKRTAVSGHGRSSAFDPFSRHPAVIRHLSRSLTLSPPAPSYGPHAYVLYLNNYTRNFFAYALKHVYCFRMRLQTALAVIARLRGGCFGSWQNRSSPALLGLPLSDT